MANGEFSDEPPAVPRSVNTPDLLRNFLASIDGMCSVFTSVCGKKSTRQKERAAFEEHKKSAIAMFEQTVQASMTTPTTAEDCSSGLDINVSTVMYNVDALSIRFNNFCSLMIGRFDALEKRISKDHISKTTGSRTGSQLAPIRESTVPIVNQPSSEPTVSTVKDAPSTCNAGTALHEVPETATPGPVTTQANGPEQVSGNRFSARRRKRAPLLGSNGAFAIRTAHQFRPKRLLVNGLHSEIDATELAKLVEKNTGLGFQCVKIRTRNSDFYSSFVFSSDENTFRHLKEPNTWPIGTKIYDYYGQPRNCIGEPVLVNPTPIIDGEPVLVSPTPNFDDPDADFLGLESQPVMIT